MINRLFAVQDSKAGAFHAPFCAPSEGVAVRMMLDCVNREGHPYAMHPEDYTLYEVGEFEDTDGRVSGSQPRSISNLASLK